MVGRFHFFSFVRCVVVASLILSAVPATPLHAAPLALRPSYLFLEQALVTPALWQIHDRVSPEVKKQSKSWMLKAAAQWRKGQPDQARAHYDAVLALNPTHALAYLRRGSLYHAQGKLARAKKDIARALTLKLRAADRLAAQALLQGMEEKRQKPQAAWRWVLKTVPLILALSTVLSMSASSLGKGGTPPTRRATPSAEIDRPQQQSLPRPPRETFTATIDVTPEYPRYELRMPEQGSVESMLAVGKTFTLKTPLVEITRDSVLYGKEEAAAESELQPLELLDEKIDELVRGGILSAEQKQRHDTDLLIAREKLARARHGMRSTLFLPFSGEVVQNWNATTKGSPLLEVLNHDVSVVTLTKPQALGPDRRAVDVAPLIEKGYPIRFFKGGKPIPHFHIAVEGEDKDTVKVYFRSRLWRGPDELQLAIQVPPPQSEEPAYPVRHRVIRRIAAPANGIVKDFTFFQPGQSLPAGPMNFLHYDPANEESELRALQAEKAYWEAVISRGKDLTVSNIQSPSFSERFKNDLLQAENKLRLIQKELDRVERQKEQMQNPDLQAPSAAVVLWQKLLARGERIEEDEELIRLGSEHEFEAELFLDPETAKNLKPSDTLWVVLEGTQARFPALVQTRNSAGLPGDQKIRIGVSIHDSQGELKAGQRVQVERPAIKGLQQPPAPYGVIVQILQAKDYGWVRNALDEVSRDSTLSLEERARILYGVVQEPQIPDLYKEWALIKLVDIGRIDSVFHFVQAHPSEAASGLRSLAFRLLLDQLSEVSLYNLPTLSTQHVRIDHYLAALMQRDPQKYRGAVELQIRRANSAQRVLARWMKIPALAALASEENFRRRGLLFVEKAQEPFIDKDFPKYWVLSTLGITPDAEEQRDLRAIGDYLLHGSRGLTPLLSSIAPGFVQRVVPASAATPEDKDDTDFQPLVPSESAQYFASPRHYAGDIRMALKEMNSPGAKTLVSELAGNRLVLSHVSQELIQKKDLPNLIQLFNRLPEMGQTRLLADMTAAGLSDNIALYREFVAGDQSEDTAWAEFFRDFYRTALHLEKDPHTQKSIRHTLIKTYQTEIELAQLAYGGGEAGESRTIARYDLRNRIAHQLLMEQAERMEHEAERSALNKDKQEELAARADLVYAAKEVLEWDSRDADSNEDSRMATLLAQADLSLDDVQARMAHYEKLFTQKSQLWAAPRALWGSTLGITLLISALVGLVFWKPKTFSSRISRARAVKPSQTVLGFFAQKGDDEAGSLYQEYRQTKTSFLKQSGLHALISMAFVVFIAFAELHRSNAGSLLFYGLIAMDQYLAVRLIQSRQIFGKLLRDRFPRRFKVEVARMSHHRELNNVAASVFTYPVETATRFVGRHLFFIYARDYALSAFATFVALLFTQYHLAFIYLALMTLFGGWIYALSTRPSLMKRLGEDKEALLDQWTAGAELLVKMGFAPDVMRPTYMEAKSAGDRSVEEKMKYTRWLRLLPVLFPILGDQFELGLAALIIIRGMEGFLYLPDWAKELFESKPAEESMEKFLRAHPGQRPVRSLPKGAFINRISLKNFSLAVPGLFRGWGSLDRELIQEMNRDLEVGTLNFLYGKNGSGKTTLLRYLAGLDQGAKTSGAAQLQGELPNGESFAWDVREAAQYIHYFKPAALPQGMTLRTFLNLLENDEQKNRFQILIEKVDPLGLDVDHTYIGSLSQGEQERLQLAFLLAGTKKPILLLDEAVTHMDPEAQRLWLALLQEYVRGTGRLILMAEKAVVGDPEPGIRLFEIPHVHALQTAA